jgi:hypothetical protein
MSRVQYSFDSHLAAALANSELRAPRAPATQKSSSRRYMRKLMETLGLFAFGFGSSSLLIHIAVGFFFASRMSSALSIGNM